MIQVNKQDSIIDIIVKIKEVKSKEIILEFPFGHPILHNYTSLRILKTNAGDKDLIIITSDVTAKKIGKKLGIKYTLINNTDLIEHNYNFGEYCKFLFKNYIREGKTLFKNNKFEEFYSPYLQTRKEQKTKIGIYFLGFFASIALFFFVFYFAVNKTYIYITPEITVRTATQNFSFEALNPRGNSKDHIPLKQVSKLVYLTEKFATSGIDESSVSRAKGEVTFHNLFPEKVRLKQFTRVQTGSGVVYTTDTPVNIPPSSIDASGNIVAGTTTVAVTAKLYDEKGNFLGNQANTGTGVFMMLPGLQTDRDKIYAYSHTPISGGNNEYKRILGEKDIENAKKIMEGKLKDYALKQLKNDIKISNDNNNVTYEILEISDIIQWSDLGISGDESLKVGDPIEEFELNGTIKILSHTYNTQLVLNHLNGRINDSLLKEVEELNYIDKSSLRIAYEFDKRVNSPLKVKATAEVQATFRHNFLSKKNNYVEKLKFTIAGMNKEDAQKILLNNPKISNVEIETRPFFMKNISSIPNNIDFIVED